MLKYRDFVCVADPAPVINDKEHAEFLINIQKAILLSLEKRELLTRSERERCLTVLETEYSQKKQHRA